MAIRDKKIGAIERMLKNSVYAPDSRMVQSLDKCLAVLSLTTLQNLEIIIRTRIDDALRTEQEDAVEGGPVPPPQRIRKHPRGLLIGD